MTYRWISQPFSFDGGHLALDLVNTLDARQDETPTELLPGYPALLRFLSEAQLIDPDHAEQLRLLGLSRPHEATAVRAEAIALREAVYDVATGIISQQPPHRSDLMVIGGRAAEARAAATFIYGADGFRWAWDAVNDRLEFPLWLLAEHSVEFFERADLSRLRVCAAEDCDWLFLDETRNHSRKWCDMSTCGNRAKVTRYRNRTQALSLTESGSEGE